jgi:hypothetical protein
VGPINQSQRPHYEGFVLQRLAGKIPLAQESIHRPMPMYTDDSGNLGAEGQKDIRCVNSAINDQRYCY